MSDSPCFPSLPASCFRNEKLAISLSPTLGRYINAKARNFVQTRPTSLPCTYIPRSARLGCRNSSAGPGISASRAKDHLLRTVITVHSNTLTVNFKPLKFKVILPCLQHGPDRRAAEDRQGVGFRGEGACRRGEDGKGFSVAEKLSSGHLQVAPHQTPNQMKSMGDFFLSLISLICTEI